MQVSVSIGVPAPASKAGTAAPFVPTDVSGNLMWLDSTLGITLGGTMRGAGTSPPTVTLTGTLTTATAILIDVPVGGVIGVATWRYSTDGGSNFTAGGTMSGIAQAIGATGVNVTFGAGTYNTDNTFKTTVATWADQGPSSNSVTQATAGTQPLYIYSSSFACPVVFFEDASNTRMAKTTGGISGDASHSAWIRVRQTATPAVARGYCSVSATGASPSISHIGVSNTNVLNYGTGATSTPAGSTIVNGTTYSIGKTHAVGGNDQGYLNGATDGSALGRTYTLGAGFCIGARANASGCTATAELRKVLMYSTVPNSTEIANITTWLAS